MKGYSFILALAVAASVPLIAGVTDAQNGPFELPDDHFLCYKGKPDKVLGETIPKGFTADVTDQFQDDEYQIKKLRGICNPADKNGEGIVDPNTHLTAWQDKALDVKHVKTDVTTFDQFGSLQLTTVKPDRLLVPASKSLTLPPPWIVSAPNNSNHNVDHYQCYKAKLTKGAPKFPKGLQATVDDQFGEPVRTFDLKKPKLLCNPADKNGENIKNAEGHLVCYQAKPAKGEAKHTKVLVQAADQFVAEQAINTKKEDLLCVPALKNPPAEFCGDGEVNQISEQCDGDDADCPGAADVCLNDCTCVPTEARCGDGNLEPVYGEECELDGDCLAGEACTNSCTCIDSQCPETLVWKRFANVGAMVTATDHDSGWTGTAHNNTEPDEGLIVFRITDVTGSGPASCGTATIDGMDPDYGMCRCANDNRQLCDQPGELDLDDCGGESCVCYMDPPNPTLTGNVPTCSLTKVSGPVTGTWDLDAGSGEIGLDVEQTTSLSALLLDPCPTCVGDVTMNDGVRDGVCNGGINAGQSCDAQANDATLPVPGGGSITLDCFPSGPVVVNGLFSPISFGTAARNLDVVVPCGIGGADLCHCGRCDADDGIPCRTNGDCASVGGACGPVNVTDPQPNFCSDLICSPLGEGQGECLADTDKYCDGLVRAAGTGLIGCTTNADCDAGVIGVDAGDCLLTEERACVPDVVTLTGSADPASPIVVSAECIAPSADNLGANAVAGYPGPGLRKMQLESEARCVGNPGAVYPSCP